MNFVDDYDDESGKDLDKNQNVRESLENVSLIVDESSFEGGRDLTMKKKVDGEPVQKNPRI